MSDEKARRLSVVVFLMAMSFVIGVAFAVAMAQDEIQLAQDFKNLKGLCVTEPGYHERYFDQTTIKINCDEQTIIFEFE